MVVAATPPNRPALLGMAMRILQCGFRSFENYRMSGSFFFAGTRSFLHKIHGRTKKWRNPKFAPLIKLPRDGMR